MRGKMAYLWAAVLCCLAVLILPPAECAGFSDVEEDSWYEAAVDEMAERGLLHGYPDGRFGPQDPITAAQFVAIAVRCAGLPPASGQTAHWAAGSLAAALQAGWYDWDELPPTGETFDQPISRQLAIKILMKALLPQAKGDFNRQSARIQDFADLNGRYYEAVLAAYEYGVATGDEAGRFRPESSLTRAEACTLFLRALAKTGGTKETVSEVFDIETSPLQPVVSSGGTVSKNGWLQVVGTQLCNEAGEPIVLRGMSSHGLQWYGQYTGRASIENTAANGANVFRVAMYTGEGGYLSQPESMTQQLIQAVDNAIGNDLYVIIDWHILSDGNPMSHVTEAESFFSGMAARYAQYPNVLYEICNEPNGNVTWAGEVKPYAERIIAAIRAWSPRAVILIGSPTWSQDIHLAAANPVVGENLMYTLHFYAGTHGKELRDRIDDVLSSGLPVFVSEWGTSRADGSGGVFLEESAVWLDFLAQRNISWCNWSLCDKSETSAALRPGTSLEGPWGEVDMTDSGKFVFSRFLH